MTFYTEERGLSFAEGPEVTMAEWTVKTRQVKVTQKMRFRSQPSAPHPQMGMRYVEVKCKVKTLQTHRVWTAGPHHNPSLAPPAPTIPRAAPAPHNTLTTEQHPGQIHGAQKIMTLC